jgi:hypothetical protein
MGKCLVYDQSHELYNYTFTGKGIRLLTSWLIMVYPLLLLCFGMLLLCSSVIVLIRIDLVFLVLDYALLNGILA